MPISSLRYRQHQDLDGGSERRVDAVQHPARREFMKSAAAIGAAMLVGAARVFPALPKPRKVLVGGHGWVYAAPMPEHDYTPVIEQIFSDFKYAGIEAFELMDAALMHDDSVDRIGSLSHKYSLPILGTSFSGNMWDRTKHAAILEAAETTVTRLAQLGGRTFGTSVGAARAPKTPEQLDAQAELLRRIIALCQAHGIVLNLHNHTYEVENGMHDLEGTLARIPDVKLGPDLNWLVRGGVNPVDFIQRFGKQIVFMHIRDQKTDGTWSEAVGEGNMDYPSIAKALHAIPFTGDAVIELAHEKGFQLTRPLRDDWKISREFVRKTLGY
jgi:sugar phosphate isomerase/epimerase